MPLWTDVIDPATLTGYARESLADYEARRGSLSRWLPNRDVADIVVRFIQGRSGLVDTAYWRAYDAEPEIGNRESGRRVTIELPALGLNIPVSEYEQIRLRSGGEGIPEATALATIQTATDRVVRAVADAVERLRGTVLATGRATIDQYNFKQDDDFGRRADHSVVAPTLWTDTSTSRLDYLVSLVEKYTDNNGQEPGAILASTRVVRALGAGEEFQTQLVNGGARRATPAQVNEFLQAEGLPPIFSYDRNVMVAGNLTKVLPDHSLLMLPSPTDGNGDGASNLGATYWGRTLTSTEPGWGVPEVDQPGIVAGVWRNDKPPMGVEVISDAIALPVLGDADLSLVSRVLPA